MQVRLCLSFLTCKMGTLTSTFQGSCERKASRSQDLAVMHKLYEE